MNDLYHYHLKSLFRYDCHNRIAFVNPVTLSAVELANGSSIFRYDNFVMRIRFYIEQLFVNRNSVTNIILVGYKSKQKFTCLRRLDFLDFRILNVLNLNIFAFLVLGLHLRK